MGKDSSGPEWGEGLRKPSTEGVRDFEEMIPKKGGRKLLLCWSRGWAES